MYHQYPQKPAGNLSNRPTFQVGLIRLTASLLTVGILLTPISSPIAWGQGGQDLAQLVVKVDRPSS